MDWRVLFSFVAGRNGEAIEMTSVGDSDVNINLHTRGYCISIYDIAVCTFIQLNVYVLCVYRSIDFIIKD